MILIDFEDHPRPPAGTGPPLHLDITGEIEWRLVDRIAAQLADHQDAAELHLTINSPGGLVGAAFDLYAAIRRHPAGRKTALIHRAESAALLIALAADERTASPDNVILLHCAASGLTGRCTAQEHADAASQLAWVDANMAALLAYRTGHPAKTFAGAMADEEPSSIAWCRAVNILTEKI